MIVFLPGNFSHDCFIMRKFIIKEDAIVGLWR